MPGFKQSATVMVCLLLLAGCGKSDDPSDPGKAADKQAASGVTLSADQAQGLGIQTIAAQPAQYRAEASGYGTVVSLDTIAQADSDLMAARAVAVQSRAAARRDVYLFRDQGGAISREAMEAAVAKADSDEAQLTLAQRKAQAAFGLNPPWDSSGRRARIMADLSSGRLVLVRVTFPLGALAGGLPQSLTLARLGGSQRWTGSQPWRAPADPAFPGRGIFVLVAGSDLAQNDHVTAYVPAGTPQAGVKVPSAAIVYGEGESWAYVRKSDDNFQRVRLDTSRVLEGGYFLPEGAGIAPGDPIVTSGAGLLLARELNPSTEAGD
jgi:hypothetical protein